MTSDLDAAHVERELLARGAAWGKPLTIAAETGSTNDDAKTAARAGAPQGAAFVAEAQRAGEVALVEAGIRRRAENLYASWVLRPDLTAQAVPTLTLAAGLAVCDALGVLLPGAAVRIKWPNDVLIDGLKVAGVLSEAQMTGTRIDSVVIGIGLNARTLTFPEELAHRATSLALAGVLAIDRGALFVSLCLALHHRASTLERSGLAALLPEIRARDALAGRKVVIEGFRGTAVEIDEAGMLAVRGEDGTLRRYGAGEATLRESGGPACQD